MSDPELDRMLNIAGLRINWELNAVSARCKAMNEGAKAVNPYDPKTAKSFTEKVNRLVKLNEDRLSYLELISDLQTDLKS